MSNKDQRTEKATPHKLREERKKGRMFRNREVVVAGIFLFEIAFFKWNLLTGFNLFREFCRSLLEQPVPRDMSPAYIQELGSAAGLLLAKLLGPWMGLVLLFSFAGQLAQGGWNFSLQGIQFSPAKMIPKNNFTRIFSATGFFDMAKSVLMFTVIALMGWDALAALWPQLPMWSFLRPGDSTAKVLGVAYNLTWNICLAYAVLAALDYLLQKRQFGESMKMTKQDVRDEYKMLEGNPQVKGKIRNLQYRMGRQRMMKEVATANMVITNPTHYAVALRYDSQMMQAPEVVAKGRGWLALKIRSVAEEHRVPIVENKPLAQLLYKKVEVGEAIPVELYRAVAEILAYLMKAREAFRN